MSQSNESGSSTSADSKRVAPFEKEMRNSDLKANGLYFRVCVNASKRVVVERKYKEFEFLRQALARAFPGCYVPRLLHSDLGSVASAFNLSGDLPQGYLERRKFQVQCRNIDVFCQKISE